MKLMMSSVFGSPEWKCRISPRCPNPLKLPSFHGADQRVMWNPMAASRFRKFLFPNSRGCSQLETPPFPDKLHRYLHEPHELQAPIMTGRRKLLAPA